MYFFLLYIYIIFIRGKEKVRWAGEFWCGWGCCGIGFDMLRCQFDLKLKLLGGGNEAFK